MTASTFTALDVPLYDNMDEGNKLQFPSLPASKEDQLVAMMLTNIKIASEPTGQPPSQSVSRARNVKEETEKLETVLINKSFYVFKNYLMRERLDKLFNYHIACFHRTARHFPKPSCLSFDSLVDAL